MDELVFLAVAFLLLTELVLLPLSGDLLSILAAVVLSDERCASTSGFYSAFLFNSETSFISLPVFILLSSCSKKG
jgi:hypothetical protein